MSNPEQLDYDFVVIGSGFGGSVSALRLAEKGHRVLVLEQGKALGAKDMPKTNWNLRRWLWLPGLKFFGLFKMTFFKHVTVISGVGVGGGSLVYANTLPVPKSVFFKAASWAHLADWEAELKPYYTTALKMLGATENPKLQVGDLALKELGRRLGREEYFEPTQVAVFFGKPEVTVEDPYFGGEGIERAGCRFCGSCMTGCPHNAKNTLDKNYLHFAQKRGARVQAESEVVDVTPLDGAEGASGYLVKWRRSTSFWGPSGEVRAGAVVFSGGVLGTLKLLLKLKTSSLPQLSDRLGYGVRTNSESLTFSTTYDAGQDFSEGIAIGALLETDENSHLEIVRYGAGSGFWRLLSGPMVQGGNLGVRLWKLLWDMVRHPVLNFRALSVKDWARSTHVLLFMQSLDSRLRFKRGLFGGLSSSMEQGAPPTALMPEAAALAQEYAELTNAKPMALVLESLLGIPSTAHILGGACMGRDATEGVIDQNNRVFGYQNLWICDGSMISANIGVNPSLTITALTERAMDKIPP
ncbi:MAG: GMC oxidoreductase [bacterium]|nr:GMC oxidoreductase [bacterium]